MADDIRLKVEHDIFPCKDDYDRLGDCDYPYCGCRCHKGVLMMQEAK